MVKYEIEVNREECIACGVCYTLFPSYFEPDEEGNSQVIGGETDESLSTGTFDDEEMENVKEAETSCPVSAIIVTEL